MRKRKKSSLVHNHNPNNQTTTPRRSPRLLLLLPQNQNSPTALNPEPAKSNHNRKKSLVVESRNRNYTVGSRRSPRLNLNNGGVVGFSSLRRSPRLSNHKVPCGNEQMDNKKSSKSDEFSCHSGKSMRVTKENSIVTNDEGPAVEEGGGGKSKARNGDRIEVGVKRKRGGGEEISAKGWTKEQELALQTAYFTAKPCPYFWKSVSRLVPGKSQQECFDRIHRDHITPPPSQPRSRAKTIKSTPLHKFSISASKLLKPIHKTVRRSNFLKPKNYITQKSIEKLLHRHLKVDQDRKGDIFSVLEPNIDFSSNTVQPSEGLSTPKQLKENQGLLQSCTETSSSSHKKPLSRFSSLYVTNLVSPPVLKQVKNRELHEKYINQLRCREARRRASSARTQIPVSGKIIGEGSSIQTKDAVKAAKVALVSEAREAITKFQQSQVNFMGDSYNSDDDNDDCIGVEDESQ